MNVKALVTLVGTFSVITNLLMDVSISIQYLRTMSMYCGVQVMLDSVMEDSTVAGWVSLDVTGAVSDWHRHQHRPMALMIRVEDDRQREVRTQAVLTTLNCDSGQ